MFARLPCLVAVWRLPPTSTGVAEWLRLVNSTSVDLAVSTVEAREGTLRDLPVGPGIDWKGDLSDIGRIARWIADQSYAGFSPDHLTEPVTSTRSW